MKRQAFLERDIGYVGWCSGQWQAMRADGLVGGAVCHGRKILSLGTGSDRIKNWKAIYPLVWARLVTGKRWHGLWGTGALLDELDEKGNAGTGDDLFSLLVSLGDTRNKTSREMRCFFFVRDNKSLLKPTPTSLCLARGSKKGLFRPKEKGEFSSSQTLVKILNFE